jgi:hypothetical protein
VTFRSIVPRAEQDYTGGVGDRQLEALIERTPEPRRGAWRQGGITPAVLRLQRTAGNGAVAALLQRTPSGGSPTPASIGDALSKIKLTKTSQKVRQLEPWEIFRLVPANTPKKKELYKELHAAWSALEAAKRKLAAADKAPSTSAGAVAPALARAPKGKGKGQGKGKHAEPVDPATARAAAAKAVEIAQARVDKAIEAIKQFIAENDPAVRKAAADERSLKKSLGTKQRGLAALKAKKAPDQEKVRTTEAAIASLQQELSAIPQRRKDAIDDVMKRIANTSFAPEEVERTKYAFEIEGESVTLSDRVDSWATMYEQGLVEADRAVGRKLDDVLAGTALSESNKKILRAISDNESGGAPWSSVNTYDRAVLTWGLVQWTGGSQSDLTAALTTIKLVAPDAFAERFEKYGIDVINDELVITGADGSTTKGDAAALGIMGSPTLSAVMSRAGLDSKIQEAEVAAAAKQQITAPLGATFDVEGPPPGDAGRAKDADKDKEAGHKRKGDKVTLRYSDVLTSEYVVGLFADQVVNSGKGKTQRRVAVAVRDYIRRTGADPHDFATWAPDLQASLIEMLSPFKNRAVPFGNRGCSKVAGSYKQ